MPSEPFPRLASDTRGYRERDMSAAPVPKRHSQYYPRFQTIPSLRLSARKHNTPHIPNAAAPSPPDHPPIPSYQARLVPWISGKTPQPNRRLVQPLRPLLSNTRRVCASMYARLPPASPSSSPPADARPARRGRRLVSSCRSAGSCASANAVGVVSGACGCVDAPSGGGGGGGGMAAAVETPSVRAAGVVDRKAKAPGCVLSGAETREGEEGCSALG